MKNREWAYATLKGVSVEEALREDVKTVCEFLAKETGYSSDTFRPFTPKKNRELSPSIVKAIECAKMKQLLLKVANSPQKLYDAPHVRVSLNLIEDIEHFLNREEK